MELREGEECEETAKVIKIKLSLSRLFMIKIVIQKLKYPRWVIFIATSNVLEKFTYFGIKGK